MTERTLILSEIVTASGNTKSSFVSPDCPVRDKVARSGDSWHAAGAVRSEVTCAEQQPQRAATG
jgi:hypothetical protein